MNDPVERKETYEDLLKVPRHLVAEIIYGQLITHPRPAPKHARASSSLGVEIGGPFDRGRQGPGGWWILDEPEIHLGADVVVPDLAGWRRERMTELPETPYFDVVPDWLCEVLSPSTARVDRIEKMPIYAREGVSHLWLIDPDIRTLEVFELREGNWTLIGAFENDNRVSAAPFAEIELELTSLWAD